MSGISSIDRPISPRFLAQVLEALQVASSIGFWESATKTMPSTPLRTSLPRGVVEDLAGDGVELQTGLESADDADVDGKQIKEERSVGFRLRLTISPRLCGEVLA